ncbi:unnamed protein product [Durusdinium trenchii]|uniref:Uncharacterized protein n=1 Tax=Durusdinium trenchii TaxID=1381693 RepID=A0ABP0LSK6_9DINO
MVYVIVNPTRYGAPTSRKRIYLIMVQEAVMTEGAKKQDFGDFIKDKMDKMKTNEKRQWIDLLLSGDHPAVVRDTQKKEKLRLRSGSKPAGKFLSITKGRYLLGREITLLMGHPIHRLNLSSCSESVLHSLGGNAMSMRAVLPCMCAAISACVPERLLISWSDLKS